MYNLDEGSRGEGRGGRYDEQNCQENVMLEMLAVIDWGGRAVFAADEKKLQKKWILVVIKEVKRPSSFHFSRRLYSNEPCGGYTHNEKSLFLIYISIFLVLHQTLNESEVRGDIHR